jgi:Tfp pilus assembly protein PilN
MAQRMAERRETIQAAVTKMEAVEARLKAIEAKNAWLKTRPEKLVNVVNKRTRWAEALDGIHGCMPAGMWLVSVAPAASSGAGTGTTRDRTRRSQASAAAPAAKSAGTISRLRIQGRIFLDQATDKSIVEFRDALRASPLLTENTDIEQVSILNPDDYAREFTMLIELKDPI